MFRLRNIGRLGIVSVGVTGLLMLLALPASAWHVEPSPAGCSTTAHNAHASHNFDGFIGYRVEMSCNWRVDKLEIEIWGDRSSWSGWRQHTNNHETVSKANRDNFRAGAHKEGLNGTYDYRTRGKGWSTEAGKTYYRQVWGNGIRIECGAGFCDEV